MKVSFALVGIGIFKINVTLIILLLPGPLQDFSHAIEPHLRKLGMPTKLDRGVVTLFSDFTVCKKGNVLTPEQAKILKLVGRPIAKFKITTEYCHTKENGFEVLKANPNSKKKSMKAKTKVKPKAKKSKSPGSGGDSEEESLMEIVPNSDESEDDENVDDESDDEMN
jgi:mRNA turnover protein 4